jgi:hypothetical protein
MAGYEVAGYEDYQRQIARQQQYTAIRISTDVGGSIGQAQRYPVPCVEPEPINKKLLLLERTIK